MDSFIGQRIKQSAQGYTYPTGNNSGGMDSEACSSAKGQKNDASD
jgi:hypothetical protein